MKIPIASINILLATLILNDGNVVGKKVDDTHDDNRNLYFVNPCTGSISMDEPEEQDLPCLPKFPTDPPTIKTTPSPTIKTTDSPTIKTTPSPTIKATDSPTIKTTPSPTTVATNAPSIVTPSPTPIITDPIQSSPTRLPSALLPTLPPIFVQTMAPTAEFIDRYQCPGEDCTFDFESGENAVQVQYHYSVETSSSVADPSEYLPELEHRLLEKVANVMLAHCLEVGDIRRSLTKSQTTTFKKRRSLHTARRLATVGVCSIPADEYLSQETCVPEENPSNNCFIIKGGMSVAIEDGDSPDAISEELLGIVENVMTNDELLSGDTPEVEKVTFIGDLDGGEDDDGGAVVTPIDNGDLKKEKNNDGVIIGSSFALLAILLLAALYRRRKKETSEQIEVSETPFGIEVFAGTTNGSFVAPDSFDIGKETSAMDVHHCTSQMCTKCYRDPRVQFVSAPINDNGRFARENRFKVPTNTFSADSESSSVNTDEFF